MAASILDTWVTARADDGSKVSIHIGGRTTQSKWPKVIALSPRSSGGGGWEKTMDAATKASGSQKTSGKEGLLATLGEAA